MGAARVPLRLEIGPKDIEKAQCSSHAGIRARSRRAMAGMTAPFSELLEEVQRPLRPRRRVSRRHTQHAETYDAFKQHSKGGPVSCWAWCGTAACEAQIKNEYAGDDSESVDVPRRRNVRAVRCARQHVLRSEIVLALT